MDNGKFKIMKFLTYLEKSKFFWSLLVLCIIFFLLRLPSVIEPYWYGDEGIYEVMGQAIDKGWLLYRDIWDNKPPLLYLVYAVANGDQTTVRVMSLVVGLLSVVFFFLLSKKLFSSLRISIATTSLYILLFATPLVEGNIANAENFMLLPIIMAGLIVYTSSLREGTTKQSPVDLPKSWGLPRSLSVARNDNKMKLFIAGLLLGIAFLFKIVALFDFAAFFLFVLSMNLQKINRKHFKQVLQYVLPMTFGFFLPLLITILYFASHGALKDFIQAAFFGNVGYVGWQNNFLGIPQGFLLLKLLLLVIVLLIVFLKRKLFSHTALFIALWVVFSLFNTFFSGRPYTHYVLVLLPSFCLLIGLFFASRTKPQRVSILLCIIIVMFLTMSQFRFGVTKTIAYYQNTLLFVTGEKDVTSYQAFFDRKTPRDYAVASFINTHTTPEDNVFIWGNNAQIYALSNKLPPNKYTVAYHISQNKAAINETQEAIDRAKPKYIITLNEIEPLPFRATLYIMRFTLEGATIYERSL